MKVILYCLGEKALQAITGIKPNNLSLIELLVVGKDKNVQNDYSDDIIHWADNHNVAWIFREQFNNGFKESTDLLHIAMGWRWIIQVEAPNLVVLHDSLLPKYRGFNPTVTALLNGDREIGVTALFGSEQYDEGDILFQTKIDITYPIRIREAISLLGHAYSAILANLLGSISSNALLIGKKQDPDQVSYSIWRDENDYRIDWSKDAKFIRRFVDGLGYPYKGASTVYNGALIRIVEVEVVELEGSVAFRSENFGKVILKKDNQPVIICGEGFIQIKEAKYEDGQKVIFKEFRIRLDSSTS